MNKLEQAMEDHKKGNWQQADMAYEEMLQQEPDNSEIMYLLAVSKSSQNQLDEAERIIDDAIKINSNAPAYLQTKGVILARKGKTDQAIEILSRALTENPNLYQSHITIGHLYYTKGMKAEAAKHFKMAIKVDEKQVEGHVNLARILVDDGEAQEAINILNELEKDYPEQVSIKMMMGQAFIERGAHSFAENYFQKVLAMYPEYDLAGLYLGITKINTGDLENAEKLIVAFNQEHPNTREGLAALGLLTFKRNNFRISVNYLRNAIGEGIAPMTWRVAMVEGLVRIGQTKPAISLYRELGDKIKFLDTVFRLAELYELIGKTKKAKKKYKQIKEQDSKYIAALLGMARCNLIEEKAEKAEIITSKILDRNEDHAEGLLLKVTSLLFQDKTDEALKYLNSIDYQKYNDVYKKTFRLQHGLVLDHLQKYKLAWSVFKDENKMEKHPIQKIELLNNDDIKKIQSFKSEVKDKMEPIFVIGAQSTAINEFSYWLNQQGIKVLNDRLVSKGRLDILYTEQPVEVLVEADEKMVELERELYFQKAEALLKNDEDVTFVDCMYINPKQISIIKKFFPNATLLLLSRDVKDIELNQQIYGQEPINANDWNKAKEQIIEMGLNIVEINTDKWMDNQEETQKKLAYLFNQKMSYQNENKKYWRKTLFEKGHWQNYNDFY